MIIKKFDAPTEKEAEAMAKAELGPDAIIMNVKTIRPGGPFKMFKKTTIELTAAIDDNMAERDTSKSKKGAAKSGKQFGEAFANSSTDFNDADTSKKSDDIIGEKINTLARLLDQQSRNEGSLVKPVREQTQSLYDAPHVYDRPGPESSAGPADMDRYADISARKAYMREKYEKEQEALEREKAREPEENKVVTLIKKQLIDNEVSPEHAEAIINELDTSNPSKALDVILSSVYQKIVLKLGQIEPIKVSEEKPKIVFFAGNTGVGKTTTMAKLASKLILDEKLKVAMFSVDTYRIAAIDQIKTYANILSAPMEVVYTPDDMQKNVDKYSNYDIIMVDTAGRSHTNESQNNDLVDIINSVEDYEKEVYLVLSVTTKYSDLLNIANTYSKLFDFKYIFTKLDETRGIGNILNLKLDTDKTLAYVTWGQNVPDDIGEINPQVIAKKLLGGAD
jgi:flagellar biosynthesis protein FlhF